MSRLFYHTMQDNLGNLLFDVSGTMRLAGTGTLATIYGDEALTVILPNPMTNHSSFGSFKCFLPVGDFDFYMAKPGYTFETLTGVQGYGTMAQQDADEVAITGGTVAGLASLQVNGTAAIVGNTTIFGNVQTGSNVGIGMVPVGPYALSVNGQAQVSTFFLCTGNANVTGNIETGGNVGIGMVPVGPYALSVNGQMQVATFFLCSGNANILGNLQTGPNVGIGIAPSGSFSLTTNGAVNVSGNLNANGFVTFGVASAGYSLQVNNAAKPGGGSWADTASMRKYKENVQPIVGALARLLRLEGAEYTHTHPSHEGKGREFGFMAEDVREVFPHWIEEPTPGELSYGEQGLTAFLVEALREIVTRLEALEARLAAVGAPA